MFRTQNDRKVKDRNEILKEFHKNKLVTGEGNFVSKDYTFLNLNGENSIKKDKLQ